MRPRHLTLPKAQTSSAREAQKSFYCELCSKGYSRMNDYEAHLSSYDHSHKQRLRDMKAMVRDSGAATRARRAEAKDDAIVSIKLPEQEGSSKPASGGGFKKGGFKKSGFKSAAGPAPVKQPTRDVKTSPSAKKTISKPRLLMAEDLEESDTENEGYEVYDPRFPTD